MEIKTIQYLVGSEEKFDAEVNEALSEGWILDKRYISGSAENHKRIYIAEMVKPDREISRD